MKKFAEMVRRALWFGGGVFAFLLVADPALAINGATHPVPEPGTLSILAVGVAGAILAARRNRRK